MTPANSAQWRACAGCQVGAQRVHLRLVPCPVQHWRHPGLITTLRGQVIRAWVCDTCGDTADAGTRFPEPPYPIRDDIVLAIKRLRAAGWRLGDWEK